MIQDIIPHKFDNSFKDERPNDDSYIWIFDGNEVFMEGNDENLEIPTYKSLKNIKGFLDEKLIYLFKIDQIKFYLLCDVSLVQNGHLIRKDVNIFRKLEQAWMAFSGVTARHLYEWYSLNTHCGKCGKSTKKDAAERALYCDCCNTKVYPSILPVVMIGIINEDKILLTKYSRGSYKKYSLIAGYVEIGETLEEATKREVMEEVGLKIKNIRYYKSQPWSFSNSLLVGFYAELDGSDKVKLDKEELSEATWFKYDEIPVPDSMISLSNDMIEAFREKRYL